MKGLNVIYYVDQEEGTSYSLGVWPVSLAR